MVEFNEKKIKETLRNFNTIDNSGSFLYQPEQSIFIESGENAGTGNRICLLYTSIEKMPVYEGKLTNKEIFLWKKQKNIKSMQRRLLWIN